MWSIPYPQHLLPWTFPGTQFGLVWNISRKKKKIIEWSNNVHVIQCCSSTGQWNIGLQPTHNKPSTFWYILQLLSCLPHPSLIFILLKEEPPLFLVSWVVFLSFPLNLVYGYLSKFSMGWDSQPQTEPCPVIDYNIHGLQCHYCWLP